MTSPFNTNHTPKTGELLALQPGLGVVTAPNPGPMTFTGTQTYLLGENPVAVIDPGPNDPDHLQALLRAIGGRLVSHILVTHSHLDHSPLARPLAEATGAPIYAFGTSTAGKSPLMERLATETLIQGGEGVDKIFTPDVIVKGREFIETRDWRLQALHTPGHMSNHLCFLWQDGKALLSGDHVMGWATTVVSPPDGDLQAFMKSLDQLLPLAQNSTFFPGHGGAVADPATMIRHQISHRQHREAQILSCLDRKPARALSLAHEIYTGLEPRLMRAATRNVFAHLIDLSERGIVAPQGALGAEKVFRLK